MTTENELDPPAPDTRAADTVPIGSASDNADPAAARNEPISRFAPGSIVARRFRIVSLVGAGGMGEVYRAEDLRLGQTVALKFVARHLAHHPQVISMLHQEVRLGREVSHPNVARLHDVYDWDGMLFVSMEFIDGEDVSALLRRIGRLPADKAVEIAREITRGLAAAHDRGVLHRDLKPANIMVDGRGEARITDFGLAITGDEPAEEAIGTPAYMAPEQLAGAPATVQSDLYALGLVLYELFTGRRVRVGRSSAAFLKETAPPPPPSSLYTDIDPSIDRVILRCLAADPAQRPRSAREVLLSLPGGDRLSAALAAGETPSPDAVVAAEVGGLLSARAAAALAGTIMLLLCLLVVLKHQLSPPALTEWTRPPAVLADRARVITESLAIPVAPYTRMELQAEPAVMHWIRRTDSSPDRWQQLAGLPHHTVRWHTYTRPVAPLNTTALPPTASLPDVELRLDLDGRLRALQVRNPRAAVPVETLLEYTGLSALSETAPVLPSPLDVNGQMAWTGRRAADDLEERVEIGLRDGQPVWLSVQGPWDEPAKEAAVEIPFATSGLASFRMIAGVAVVLIATVLAWRNLRNGRGDRTGALRLAMVVAAIQFAAIAVGASYPPWLGDRLWVIRNALSDALLTAGILFVVYLALEPIVRRHWPEVLIAWRRLLAGQWHDSLVGRDLMVGIIGGLVHALLAALTWSVPRWLGDAPDVPGGGALGALFSTRDALEFLGRTTVSAINLGLAYVLMLAVLVALTRRRWAGAAGLLIFLNAGLYLAVGELRLFPVLISIVAVTVVVRFGLLAAVVMQLTFFMTFSYPLLVDTSRWFFWTSALPVFLLGGLTCLACRSAMGTGRARTA